MEEKFNALIEISVSKNKYTYFFFMVSFFLWFSNNMLNTGIILLTQMSRIKYDNDTIFLNLTICKEFDYDISKVQFIEKFNYSIIAENNLECSIKSKVYMMFPYLGYLIGGFLFVILPQKFTHKSLVYVGISGSIFSLYLGGYKKQLFLTFLMMLISSINSTIVCLEKSVVWFDCV